MTYSDFSLSTWVIRYFKIFKQTICLSLWEKVQNWKNAILLFVHFRAQETIHWAYLYVSSHSLPFEYSGKELTLSSLPPFSQAWRRKIAKWNNEKAWNYTFSKPQNLIEEEEEAEDKSDIERTQKKFWASWFAQNFSNVRIQLMVSIFWVLTPLLDLASFHDPVSISSYPSCPHFIL